MKVSHLLAAVAILGLAGFAMAARGNKAPAGLHGKVVSVDAAAKTVTVKAKSGEVVVTTDAGTTVTLDGAAATLADLKADMTVTVTPATGVATKIVAKTAAAHKPIK
jgi:hypothetical protein